MNTVALPETQSRALLQAELDAGKELYLPTGRYLVDGLGLNIAKGKLVGEAGTEIFNTTGGTVLRIASPQAAGRWVYQSSQWSDDASGAMLTIDLQVPTWSLDQTFICGSFYNGLPGPWYVLGVAGGTQIAVLYKTTDGVVHTDYAPMQNPFTYTFPSGLWNSPTRSFEVNDQLAFNVLSLPWVRLIGPGHAYGPIVGHAFAIRSLLPTVGPVEISDLLLHSNDSYGQVLSIGPCVNALIERVDTAGGAQGIGTLDYGGEFPLHLRDCVLQDPSHCNLYLRNAIADCTGLTLQGPAQYAALLKGSVADFYDTFVSDGPAVQDVFAVLDGRGNGGRYSFHGTTADFEGGSPQSYWNVERHADTPKTELRIEGASLGKLGGPAQVVLRECELGGATGPCTAYLDKDLTVQKGPSWSVIQ